MIFSMPICPAERTTHWHWLFPNVCMVCQQQCRRNFFVRLLVMTLRILGLTFVAGQPTSATAQQSYPWCAQGDNILHCYYNGHANDSLPEDRPGNLHGPTHRI